MNEPVLRWRLELAEGVRCTGEYPLTAGANHICCDLPRGTLQRVEATLSLALSPESALFLNGYQSWTHCPERRPDDRIRGLGHVPAPLLRRYHFDRYGDYHFVSYPDRRGRLHGVSYGYVRTGDRFSLIASLDETPGYTLLDYDHRAKALTLVRDCAGVAVEGSFHLFDLYCAQGTEEAVFDGWFDAMGVRPRTAVPLTGYSSWYNRYQDISRDAILSDLEGCKGLLSPGDLFQIDDGWEPFVGDWLEPDAAKFPGGMASVVERIHEAGFQAGLWLAPFVCETNSALFRTHPDWLLRVEDAPWSCGCNWSGFYALDIDHPQVRRYLEEVFHRVLEEWGFDLVKLDFLYGAAPFPTAGESRAARMTRAMDTLRRLCGDKQILACGVPLMPAFGRVEYCRIGCDVSLDWDDAWWMRRFHRERVSTLHSIQNTVARRQLDGRAFGNDPDVFFLRTQHLKLTEAQKQTLATVNALLGSALLISDDPGSYSPEQRDAYRQVLRLRQAEEVRVSDAGEGLCLQYRLEGKTHTLPLP